MEKVKSTRERGLIVSINTVLKKRGITKQALAKNLGMGRSYITRVCNGEIMVSIRLALRIAAALNVDPRDIFTVIKD